MASKSDFLQLILPLNNEYQNVWDEALNYNFTRIDEAVQDLSEEVTAARGSQSSLAVFLSNGHNQDGTLKVTPEVQAARTSYAYGSTDGSTDFDLKKRLDMGDKEVFEAREGLPSLRAALAGQRPSQILSGAKDANGNPTWMGSTGNQVNVNGATTPIRMLIDGYTSQIRTNKSVTISGSSGTKYIYASLQSSGLIVHDGDSSSAPPVSPNGVTTSDGSKVTLLHDATVDFTSRDVKAGDILRILGSSANAGDYVISSVAPNGDVNKLKIQGVFPGGSIAALNYTVIDPLAVTLGFDDAKVEAEGKLYIGEAQWDGSSVVSGSALARAFKNEYVSEWRSVDVSSTPTFEEVFSHQIGSDLLDVVIQVSQSNDGSTPVEELSLASVASTLALSFTNTLALDPGSFSAGSFNPGTPGSGGVAPSYSPLPSLTPPALNGTVAASLSGEVFMARSALAKYDRNKLYIKNARAGLFYRDYSGSDKTTGYVRVLVRKRN